jgi:hypothetical protein
MDDRERTRQELRELVEIARTPAPPDSSGYVDLSAFSAKDPNWVEHALARSRGEVVGPRKDMPSEGESVRPVSLSEPPHDGVRLPRKRRLSTFAILVGAAYAVALTFLGVTIVRRFEPPKTHARAAAVQAPVAAPPVTAPLDIPPPPPATATAPDIPAAAPLATTTVAPSLRPGSAAAPIRKKALVAAPPAAAVTQPRPPLRAPALPKPSRSGDPLMSAIQQSLH